MIEVIKVVPSLSLWRRGKPEITRRPNLDLSKLAEWFMGLPSPGKKLVQYCWHPTKAMLRLAALCHQFRLNRPLEGCVPCTFRRNSAWGPKADELVLPGTLGHKAATVGQSSITILGT